MAELPESSAKPKRFYQSAQLVTLETGFGVSLDARRLRTPAGAGFALPSQALAALVAAEWDAQGASIDQTAMPLTRLAFTAVDRIARARSETAAEVARYAGSDLLCYFADAP